VLCCSWVTAPCYGPPDGYKCYGETCRFHCQERSHTRRSTHGLVAPDGSSTHPEHNLHGWNARYHLHSLYFHAVFIKYFRSFSVFSYSFSSSVSDNSHLSPFLFYPLLFALFLLFPVSFPDEKSTGSQQEERVELNKNFPLTPLWRKPYCGWIFLNKTGNSGIT
jgi:hypothetical protein